MLRSKLFLLAFMTLWFTPAAYGAGFFYVSSTGCSDSSGQPGTEAQPWCSLSYGLTRISGGSTLYVKNGTYSGAFTITGPSGTAGAHTVISAYPGHTPILNGPGLSGGRMKISHGCSYIDFVGFTITNHNQGLYVDDDAGTSTPCHHVNIINVTVHDVGQEGIAIRGNAANVVLDGVVVYNTGRLGTSQNGEGIYIGSGSGPIDNTSAIVRNSTIHDTQDEGIELKGGTHDCLIENNTLYNIMSPGSSFSNTGGAIELDEPNGRYGSNPNHIIRGNIIRDVSFTSGLTKRGIRLGTGATAYNNVLYNINGAYNCLLSNSADYTRLVYHNTIDCTTANAVVNSGTTIDSRNNIGPTGTSNRAFSAAYFVNAAGHDYHLVAGSAPVNAGADLRSTVATDKDGVARDAQPDQGAYEFGSVQLGPPAAPTNLRIQP